ncbi:histidinol dehydrogenase [Streptomyces plumbiresistens]|uniref:histidinol dehydrogenase n=1 Tax=Streptomyces plumbiresistens TaxID=511811 RepID=UPI0031F1853A
MQSTAGGGSRSEGNGVHIPAISAASDENARRQVQATVAQVIADVRSEGDAAIRRYSEQFDRWSPESFRLASEEIERIIAGVPAQTIEDIKAVQARSISATRAGWRFATPTATPASAGGGPRIGWEWSVRTGQRRGHPRGPRPCVAGTDRCVGQTPPSRPLPLQGAGGWPPDGFGDYSAASRELRVLSMHAVDELPIDCAADHVAPACGRRARMYKADEDGTVDTRAIDLRSVRPVSATASIIRRRMSRRQSRHGSAPFGRCGRGPQPGNGAVPSTTSQPGRSPA